MSRQNLLACSIKMSGSKSKLKVRTLDEIFKKTSKSSENDPEQLAHTSENIPALNKLCFILCQDKTFEDKMNCRFQRVS
jgi:hypothetical protein